MLMNFEQLKTQILNNTPHLEKILDTISKNVTDPKTAAEALGLLELTLEFKFSTQLNSNNSEHTMSNITNNNKFNLNNIECQKNIFAHQLTAAPDNTKELVTLLSKLNDHLEDPSKLLKLLTTKNMDGISLGILIANTRIRDIRISFLVLLKQLFNQIGNTLIFDFLQQQTTKSKSTIGHVLARKENNENEMKRFFDLLESDKLTPQNRLEILKMKDSDSYTLAHRATSGVLLNFLSSQYSKEPFTANQIIDLLSSQIPNKSTLGHLILDRNNTDVAKQLFDLLLKVTEAQNSDIKDVLNF